MKNSLILLLALFFAVPATRNAGAGETQLYWGDTHLHTRLSLDAYTLKNRTAGPDTAYRYAKGLPVIHPYHRARIRINTPLDFLAVTEHAEYAGTVQAMVDGNPLVTGSSLGEQFMAKWNENRELEAVGLLFTSIMSGSGDEILNQPEFRTSVWEEIIAAAELHNEPGKFTTFIGWEWSSILNGANLHRIIFTPQGGEVARRFLPYSSFDSTDPEDLWAFLEETGEATGADFVAIPHNANVSRGKMFAEVDSEGKPIDVAYAKMRMRWEPVIEITQAKGDSETHPLLSPEDEFADFEFYPYLLVIPPDGDPTPTVTPADYARGALKRGLEIESITGANPYKFGLAAGTDSHTSMAAGEENNFWGKTAKDSIPENKSVTAVSGGTGWDMSASGLTGVWATENTRDALTAAFKRKEVYGTTGPRISLRLFGGWDFAPADARAKDLATRGYRKGVPMGGDLAVAPKGKAPTFLIRAVKDPVDANLDRIQVVKGWLDADGKSREKVFNVAASDNRKITDNRLAPVGNTVNLETASYDNSIGDSELATVWKDPEFNPGVRAFYYVRVLQIPTPRHSLYDAVALGIDPKETGHTATLQERAYSSPIWYTP
jgi:hypothetical protein